MRDAQTGVEALSDERGVFFLPMAADHLDVTSEAYRSQRVAVGGRGVQITSGRVNPADGQPLLESGVVVYLEPLRAPILGSALSVSWSADRLSETATILDGTLFNVEGWRAMQGRVEGAARLGPLLAVGQYGTSIYPLRREDSGQVIWRWGNTGEGALMYRCEWPERFGIAIGPAAVVDQVSVVSSQLRPGGESDYFDASHLRAGAGASVMAHWPLPNVATAIMDARISLWPWSWFLMPAPGVTESGWGVGGSIGLRWFVWETLGLDLRYQYQAWLGSGADVARHGALAGVVIPFGR